MYAKFSIPCSGPLQHYYHVGKACCQVLLPSTAVTLNDVRLICTRPLNSFANGLAMAAGSTKFLPVCLFVVYLLTQRTEVACQGSWQAQNSSASNLEAALPVYAYHGSIVDRTGALQPAVVHILLKAKRQPGGAFLVRTVSFLETSDLQGMMLAHYFAVYMRPLSCTRERHCSIVVRQI